MNAAVSKIEQPIAVMGEGATMLAVLTRAASDPACDVDKMERLGAMYERMESKRVEAEFNNAMSEAQTKMRPVSADAPNPQTRSNYASYGQLDKKLRPLYTASGFALSFDTGNDAPEGCVRVLCYVTHNGGHSRTYHIDMPADGKGAKGGDVMTKTHAMGAGMSYGMRYLLKMIFNVAVGEDDDDGNTASGYDATSWYDAIDAAVDMAGLNALAAELKGAGIPADALRNIRAKWSKRSKEISGGAK